MFTGIIEKLGRIERLEKEESNLHITISSEMAADLKIDQSVAHEGVCLTVVAQNSENYTVTAINETLVKTNLKHWKQGQIVNLERAMAANTRLDGHMVQGHVDLTGTCLSVEDKQGSWLFTFEYPFSADHILVDKGSICVNGVSLTVVSPIENRFSVAIIPFTFEHTTFQNLQAGDAVNLEFDVIGKYIARYMKVYAAAKV
jgi:riboflavin synthase